MVYTKFANEMDIMNGAYTRTSERSDGATL